MPGPLGCLCSGAAPRSGGRGSNSGKGEDIQSLKEQRPPHNFLVIPIWKTKGSLYPWNTHGRKQKSVMEKGCGTMLGQLFCAAQTGHGGSKTKGVKGTTSRPLGIQHDFLKCLSLSHACDWPRPSLIPKQP